MDVDIRPCRPGDEAALALIGRSTFLETFLEILPADDILAHCRRQHAPERYAEWLAAADHHLWLAEVRRTGAPVGYVMLSPPDLPVEPRVGDLEIKRIYLLSRIQRTGVGGRLMETAAEAARKAGAERLLLGVYHDNQRALDFYARQGFVRVGVRRFQVGANLYDDLVLAPRL